VETKVEIQAQGVAYIWNVKEIRPVISLDNPLIISGFWFFCECAYKMSGYALF
jgi:hypothetical protein